MVKGKQTKTVINKTAESEPVMAGGSGRAHQPAGEVHMPWERDFGSLPTNDILAMPPSTDMAGVLANSNLMSEEERIAYLRLIRRLEKFGLQSRLGFIRQCLASTLGRRGLGKTLKLQDKIELIAPALLREQLNMKPSSGREETSRGSDFRKENIEKPNSSGNGGENA